MVEACVTTILRLTYDVRATGLHPVGRGFDSLTVHDVENQELTRYR